MGGGVEATGLIVLGDSLGLIMLGNSLGLLAPGKWGARPPAKEVGFIPYIRK